MSLIKISELPAASTLNTTDITPLVQSGVTKRSTLVELFSLLKGFLASGAGAFYRTFTSKAQDQIALDDYQDSTLGTNYTAALLAGQTALLAGRGGFFDLGAGERKFSTQLAPATANKGITFLGRGASEAGGTNAPTVLNWNGGATICVDIGTDCRNLGFRDLDFENTGTATAFIRVGWTDWTTIKDVNVRPTTFPTTAAFILGIGANRCEHATLERTTVRGVATSGNVGLAADRAQDLRAWNYSHLNCLATFGIAGSMDIVNTALIGSSFSSGSAETEPVLKIIQARSWNLIASHVETQGANYCVSVPGTGTTDATGINLIGDYFSGNTVSSADVVRIDYTGAVVNLIGNVSTQFRNPYNFIRNGGPAKSIVSIGNDVQGTGAVLSTNNTNLISIGDVVAGVRQTDRGIVGVAAGTYTATDTTPSVMCTNFIYITNGAPCSITDFDDSIEGQVITLCFGDANTTLDRAGGHFYLDGSANFTGADKQTIQLVRRGTVWWQVGKCPTNG